MISRLTTGIRHRATPWVILLLSLVMTAIAWHITERAVQTKAAERFTFQTQEIATTISKRLLHYETALRGGAGLFNATEKVDRKIWHRYVNDLKIQQSYPGIQGMGFALMIPAGEINRHLAQIRAEGFPKYTVRPEGRRDPYSAIIYLEPFDWRNQRAFGYDMFAEPVRRAAMMQAMDTGEPAVSGRVTLVQETEEDVQQGFLMYAPVYRKNMPVSTVAERRTAIHGFVYSPFRARDLMHGIMGRNVRGIDLAIYDGITTTKNSLLFDSTDGKPSASHFTAQLPLATANQHWTLIFRAPGSYLTQEERLLPLIVAGAGIAIDFCLFLLISSIARKKQDAEALAVLMAARLKESEARYSSLFNSAKAPMLLIDPESGTLLETNPAAQEFYGYGQTAMASMNIFEIGTLPAEETLAQMALARHEQCSLFYFSHRLSNGEIRQVEMHAGPFQYGGRSIIYAIVHDITERKHFETALFASEQRYGYVMEATGEGIWDWDIEQNIVSHNARWCEILELDQTKARHPVEEFALLIHAGDRPAVWAAVTEALEKDRPYRSEHRMLLPGGRIVWVQDRGRVVERDEHGKPIRMVGSIADISERKRQETEIDGQRIRLENIIRGTRAGTWEWKIQTGETTFNERWAEIVGYTLEELAPISIDTWLRLAHPDDLKISGERLEAHFSGQSDYYECESRMRHKDGHWVWVLDRGQVSSWDADRKPVLMAGTHQDITHQKTIEQTLLEARQAAETANTAKSQFLATMSHELRTPMNGILGTAQLLLMPDLDEEERNRYVRTIYNSGQTLLTLLNDILDLSKIEAGKMELERAAFAPVQMLQELATLFSESCQNKSLTMQIDTTTLRPQDRYWGDPLRLRQILSNLLFNAIKFTASGGVEIQVQINKEPTTSTHLLRFAVRDSGIGISEEQRQRLFKPFSQVDGTITRRFGGTGLGLAIIKNLVELMGGQLGVDSAPGTGSTFWFEIPAEKISRTAGTRSFERSVSDMESLISKPDQSSNWHILLVEDTATNRMLIEAFLGKRGIRVTSVEDGQEAIDWIKANPRPDLILMDCQMPVMDGFEATRQIRAAESTAQRLPIIALTAGAFDEEREKCLNAGMDDFVAKPVHFPHLLNVIQHWLTSSNEPTVPDSNLVN